MLSQNHFYWNMTKKYIIAFAHIFSDIHIIRTNSAGEAVKDITVPITYAGKRKIYSFLSRDSEYSSKISTVLPRMSFIISGMHPDAERKTSPLEVIKYEASDGSSESYQANAVPYNFDIEMVIWTKNMDDLLQVVEQAVVFFNPHYVITVKEIEELGIERNITVFLNETTFDISQDLTDTTDRTILATMNFTLKGFLYPPIKDATIIKTIGMKFVDSRSDVAVANITEVWNELTENVDVTLREIPDSAEFSDWVEPATINQGQKVKNTVLEE